MRHGEMESEEMCKEHFTMRNCPTRPCSLIPVHIRDYKALALPNTDSLTSQNSSSDSGNSNRTFVAVLPKFEGAFYEDSRSEIRWDFSNGIICPPLYADDSCVIFRIVFIQASEEESQIYRAMRELEKGFRLKRNFMSRQRELDERDRVRVVDWISHHHANFCLKLETLHLAVSILDRLLCVVKFPRSKGEAIAAVALMIASKVEDVAPLKVVILVENIISYKIKKRAVMQIEQSALYHLNYRAQTPTAYNFANYFNMLVKSEPLQIELVNYLLELALRVITFAGSLPSEVALAALLLARTILRRDFSRRWMLMHFGRCGIRYEDLETAMCLFFKIFGRASTLAPNVFNEYCKREHFGIALAWPGVSSY
ncbi:Cyclin-B1-2 [Toxocara canis]|uniref:Cyclin-B1-2 n=1 Tax=Toxocara canis TaxID=6265 RepID=A0A0B2W5D3_TOXCA|nr:Cyclin-B1-2 [Toxocara canis]